MKVGQEESNNDSQRQRDELLTPNKEIENGNEKGKQSTLNKESSIWADCS